MNFYIVTYLVSDDTTYTCEEAIPFIAISKQEVEEHLPDHLGAIEDVSDLEIFTIDEWFEKKGIWLPKALMNIVKDELNA